MTASPTDDLASAERRTQELTKELLEAREQQAATAAILRVISRSPTNLQDVFATIAASVAHQCTAHDATIFQIESDTLRVVAHHGPIEEFGVGDSRPLVAEHVNGRAALERRPIQVADLQAEEAEYPEGCKMARRLGHRTILVIPLMHAGEVIGTIGIRRTEVRLFTDRQIDLLQTFADQAVIAIENTRLFEAEQASKRELTEALEQQTATADVLKVISRSTFDLQPVLEALIKDATKLCAAEQGFIFRLDGELYHLAADYNAPAGFREWTHRRGIRPGEGTVVGRVALEDRTIQIPDAQADAAWRTTNAQAPGTSGVRTLLGVPMRREGVLIGVIAMWRTEIRPFTDKQVALVETFADQAVIAVENTRLLTELRESLQQQTATADVLKVISRSALDVQKVLDALVESAARLCDARDAAIFQVFGDGLHLVAHYGQIPMSAPVGKLTLPLVRGLVTGRAVIDRQTIQVADMQAEADEYPEARRLARQTGFHTALAVPLVHAGEAIGVIFIRRTEVRPFTERQIELVNTFADQAVIAIENTRLFEEVQARTRDATEALEYQTATSDVLEAISRSPTDAQPVFETIAQSAARLCNAHFCNVFRFDGHLIHFAASYGASAEFRDEKRTRSPVVPSRGFAAARAILDNAVTEIADICADADFDHWRIASVADYRSVLAVPMRKDGLPIGAIAVVRSQIGAFPKRQIELLKTFADQAVIAIENTRLFEAEQASKRELQESLEYQTATSEVLSVISRSAFDLQPVLEAVVESATRLCGAKRGHIFRFDGEYLRFAAAHGAWPGFTEYLETHPIRPGRSGASERAALERQTVHISDVLLDPDYQQLDLVKRQGYRTVLAVPMLREGTLLGVIAILKTHVEPFTDKQIALVETFADQAVIAIENARLFEEVQARTRELVKTVEDLEIASQHKNQFVANMSHELRTPLAAILGYAELIQEGFYEPQGPKSLDALTRIRSNGKHLLGLINTVLDIAKIESGQFTLNMSEYAIESVVETVRAATESLAQNKKLTLSTSVDKSLPVGLGDEQRLTQVLLNLVGNAIKFTDAGEVSIAAGARNGHFAVSVRDTGPGIPLDQQDRIFDQFHQVDSSLTKAKGGTGLGLAIAKQIVEMHGGRIWVVSTPGKGSTFQMELPTRAEFRKPSGVA